MSALGELLTLLHDSDVRSFEGEIRDWCQPPPGNTLILEPEPAGAGRLRWGDGGPFPRARESRRRVWFARPDRLRVELVLGGAPVRVAVRDGQRWWRWDRQHGTDEGALESDESSLPRLLSPMFLSPAKLIGAWRLEAPCPAVHLGREALATRARMRERAGLPDAVELELLFDAQSGVLLRRAVFDVGRCVSVMEVLAARFDPPVEPDRFAFAAPDLDAHVA